MADDQGVEHAARLTKGMEHMRAYVSIAPTATSPQPATATTTNPPNAADTEPAEGDTYGVPASVMNPVRRPAQQPQDPSIPNPEKRTDPFQFGTRYLEEGANVYDHNAWDAVAVDDTYLAFADTQYAMHRDNPVSDWDKQRFNGEPSKWWNTFYKQNTTNFFKDRKWLFQEFPTLAECARAGAGPKKIIEVGAGAGNSAFPIIDKNENPDLEVIACDYAPKAVELMRADPRCDGKNMRAEVWDVSASGEDALPPGVDEGTIDVVVLIFIFSALAPSQWHQALLNVWRALKPGGEILLRDYGRGDLAQVRFKKGRYLEENFYVRGDGTRVYFFEEEELQSIFTGSRNSDDESTKWPAFEVMNLGTDRRMLVNRQRKLKMYRCWMQARFKKPLAASDLVPSQEQTDHETKG